MFGSEQSTITLSLYAVLPAIIILFYVYKRDYFPEPPRIVFITLLLGAGISFPLMLLIPFFEGYLETLNFGVESNHFYMSFIRAAFLEETLKFLIIIYYCLYLDEFNEPMDGIVYGVIASLGFALVENIVYVFLYADPGQEMSVGILRMFTAIPAHALMGVIMGYYVGKAKFDIDNRKTLLLKGLFGAILLHGLYNYLLLSKAGLGIFAIISLVVAYRFAKRAINESLDSSPFKNI